MQGLNGKTVPGSKLHFLWIPTCLDIIHEHNAGGHKHESAAGSQNNETAQARNIRMAKEAIRITHSGRYEADSGKLVQMDCPHDALEERGGMHAAEAISPRTLKKKMVKTKAGGLENGADGVGEIVVSLCTSLSAAPALKNPLVLNFADPKHPGGSFMSGSHAQEGGLCLAGTLCASLSS